jgi:hypothetical protein
VFESCLIWAAGRRRIADKSFVDSELQLVGSHSMSWPGSVWLGMKGSRGLWACPIGMIRVGPMRHFCFDRSGFMAFFVRDSRGGGRFKWAA